MEKGEKRKNNRIKQLKFRNTIYICQYAGFIAGHAQTSLRILPSYKRVNASFMLYQGNITGVMQIHETALAMEETE